MKDKISFPIFGLQIKNIENFIHNYLFPARKFKDKSNIFKLVFLVKDSTILKSPSFLKLHPRAIKEPKEGLLDKH